MRVKSLKVTLMIAVLASLLSPCFGSCAEPNVGEQIIHEGYDPFTLPKISIECSNWWQPPIGGKMCIGHTYATERLKTTLVVTSKSKEAGQALLNSSLQQCVREGATGWVAGLIADFFLPQVTQGQASTAAAMASLSACMVRRIPSVYDVTVNTRTKWVRQR